MMLDYRIGRFVLVSLCVRDLVRLDLSGARVATCYFISLLMYSTCFGH